MRKKQNLTKRLKSKIHINDNGCWCWTGAVFSKVNGKYAQIRMTSNEKKSCLRYAHRVSYEHFVGPVPEGKELDHLCRNTLCINPQHLEPVTHKENMLRRVDINKKYCKHGHKMEDDNVYLNPKGARECRTCRKISQKKFRAYG